MCILAHVPIATPPASVAFCMSIILIFFSFLIKKLTRKVAKTLPVRDNTVLMYDLFYEMLLSGVDAALNEGQYIHKNKVPITEVKSEI